MNTKQHSKFENMKIHLTFILVTFLFYNTNRTILVLKIAHIFRLYIFFPDFPLLLIFVNVHIYVFLYKDHILFKT